MKKTSNKHANQTNSLTWANLFVDKTHFSNDFALNCSSYSELSHHFGFRDSASIVVIKPNQTETTKPLEANVLISTLQQYC